MGNEKLTTPISHDVGICHIRAFIIAMETDVPYMQHSSQHLENAHYVLCKGGRERGGEGGREGREGRREGGGKEGERGGREDDRGGERGKEGREGGQR